MAQLNMARSWTLPAVFNCWRMPQTCFGLRGGFAQIMRPVFQGRLGMRKRSI
jgi:hypothetical protein